jgi:hypothetical protein
MVPCQLIQIFRDLTLITKKSSQNSTITLSLAGWGNPLDLQKETVGLRFGKNWTIPSVRRLTIMAVVAMITVSASPSIPASSGTLP